MLFLAILICASLLHSQTVPNADFRETAVISSFHKKNPAVVNFQTFYRRDLDQTHRLLVVRGGAPKAGWNSPRTTFFLGEGDLLGLFLMDREDPNRVWELGVFTSGNRSDLLWVDRADENSIVFARRAGDYGRSAPYWKFIFDVSSKRLLRQFEYWPFSVVRFLRTGDGLSALGFLDRHPIVVAFKEQGPELRQGPDQKRALARLPASLLDPDRPSIPTCFPPTGLERTPTTCRDLPGTSRFCLLVAKTTPEWALGVVERQGNTKQKLHSLPQSTLEEFTAARPESPNVVTQQNIQERFGPYQMADRFWFGKVFYDGEGTTGVGGVGFFDTEKARYVVYSPPALAPWSASALLVEEDAVWVGLVRYPEGGTYSGGLVRLDRQTLSAQSYLIADVITDIVREQGDLLVATANGIYCLRNGQLNRYTVEPVSGGRYRLLIGMPEQTQSGMSYRDSVLEAALAGSARSTGETIQPASAERVVEVVSENLLSYEPDFVRAVLAKHWALMPKGSITPVLIRLVDDPPEQLKDSQVRHWALRRLIELAPEEGRKRLLTELRRFSPALDEELLQLLPPQSVPPMDDRLIAYLERWQKGLAGGPSAPMLAARYLSGNARERMRVVYESQPDPCQPEMLAYFLRADPPYASKILKREPWEMHKPPGHCVMPFILRVPPRQMSPVMEEFLVACLWHEQVPVKAAATSSLGRYGSPAAQKPLWDALRYLHDYWKDRKQEMNGQSQAVWLEEQIRNAIGRARNWVVNREELQKLGSLCLGDRCVAANNQDLSYWKDGPLRLTVTVHSVLDLSGAVAQYTDLASLPDVLDKLAQFPKGSVFHLSMMGDPTLSESVQAEIRRAAGKTGCRIEREALAR